MPRAGREGSPTRCGTASFTFEDFLDQFQAGETDGVAGDQVVAMLPGAGSLLRNVEVSGTTTWDGSKRIIRSMTPERRRDPKLINGSRKRRITSGSGTTSAGGEVSSSSAKHNAS